MFGDLVPTCGCKKPNVLVGKYLGDCDRDGHLAKREGRAHSR